ncbi:MAG: sulfatase-like hydrolase/transferase, partial [Limisphaerales bacterium]
MMDLEREQPGSYRQWVESYVACVQFMDHQLGRLMEALDASPRGKETMIILWSDHGFHLGER